MNTLLKKNVQTNFNEIKGNLIEINEDKKFCNVTIQVGNHNKRNVNVICKKSFFKENIKDKFNLSDKVKIRFYLASRYKHDRWYTNASILEIFKEI
jgi:hypothetical protein